MIRRQIAKSVCQCAEWTDFCWLIWCHTRLLTCQFVVKLFAVKYLSSFSVNECQMTASNGRICQAKWHQFENNRLVKNGNNRQTNICHLPPVCAPSLTIRNLIGRLPICRLTHTLTTDRRYTVEQSTIPERPNWTKNSVDSTSFITPANLYEWQI